jgi:hypothetical protein
MTNPENVFQPAIDALEKDLTDLERQANGLIGSINLLRAKAGLPPRPSGWKPQAHAGDIAATNSQLALHSDSFTGKKLGVAARQYLEMRKRAGTDAPATSREIFDALKEGGFVSGAKDDATALVVLRTMLRKNTVTFIKLQNGKYGLRSWYPNLKPPKAGEAEGEDTTDQDTSGDAADEKETATVKTAAAS